MKHNKKHFLRLQSYFDGQIDEKYIAAIESHLKECEECRDYLSSCNQIGDILKVSHDHQCDKESIQQIWENVESRLVRSELQEATSDELRSVSPLMQLRRFMKPAIAFAIVALLVILPILEKDNTPPVFAAESQIKKISTKVPVLVFKTRNKKWNVIWIIPKKEKKGEQNVSE